MATTTDKTMMDAWKQQLDAAMRVTEAIIEGSTRLQEVQIEAAMEAHADAVATQRSLAAAHSPAELLRIQTEWLLANQRRSVEYWRHLYEAAVATQAELASCLRGSLPHATREA